MPFPHYTEAPAPGAPVAVEAAHRRSSQKIVVLRKHVALRRRVHERYPERIAALLRTASEVSPMASAIRNAGQHAIRTEPKRRSVTLGHPLAMRGARRGFVLARSCMTRRSGMVVPSQSARMVE